MKFLSTLIMILPILKISRSTIDGLTYQDPFKLRPYEPPYPRGEDPCNPLYWYPRERPAYCYRSNIEVPLQPRPAPPLPAPPLPAPPFPPQVVPYPEPCYPPYMNPMPMPQIPFGIPISPMNPMMPAGVFPAAPPCVAPFPPRMAGFVPGLPGLVSVDGGINIMPFSDVYTDMLEKHKHKSFRRKVKQLYRKYYD